MAAGRPSLLKEVMGLSPPSLLRKRRRRRNTGLCLSLCSHSGARVGVGFLPTRVCTHARAHRRTHGTLGRELTATERAGGMEIAHALPRPFFLKEGIRVPERERGQWGSVHTRGRRP